MPIQPHDQKAIDCFFDETRPSLATYGNAFFACVAVRVDGEFKLVQGAVHLMPSTRELPPHFETENIRADYYRLVDLNLTIEQFINMVLTGVIHTPHGDIQFPGDQTGTHRASYMAPHRSGPDKQNRLSILRLFSSMYNQDINQPFVEWELMAAETPYDSLLELLHDYGVGPLRNDGIGIDIYTGSVAIIDSASANQDGKINLLIRLGHGLAPKDATLGYKVLIQGRVVQRQRLPGDSFAWAHEPLYQVGTIEFDVEPGAVLQCFVSYAGQVQHFGWLVDSSSILNSRRGMYDLVDPSLKTMMSIITDVNRKTWNARDLERAVSWIFWMLGFSVVHFGQTKGIQDAVDLIATAPSGHVALIECTTGLLKAESKLSILHDRLQGARRALDASGNRHLRVLPVIVTSQPRSDILADLETAERLGMYVIAREEIDSMIQSTLFPYNADKLFFDAETSVKETLAKYEILVANNNQPGLPFEI